MTIEIGSIDTVDELEIMMEANELKGKLWRMSDKVYHGTTMALGSSHLRKYSLSPADYKASVDNPFPDTKDMHIGTAFHALLLEGAEAYRAEVGVIPKGNKNTKAYKAEVQKMKELGEWRPTMLDEKDDFLVHDMYRAASANKMVKGLLSGGHAELSAFAQIPGTDIWTKCRMDYLNLDMGYMVDLKSTKDDSFDHFNSSIFKWGYEVQMAYYRMVLFWATGLEIEGTYVLGVQKSKPHKSFPVRLRDMEIELGNVQAEHFLECHKDCTAANEWPAEDEEIYTASAPNWKLKEWGIG
jgi:hypothetical protein